jgi:hypothetical protein
MLTFGELLLVQGGVNMINKMVKEGKCSIFLNSLVCFVCVLYVSGAYWQHCIHVLKEFCLMSASNGWCLILVLIHCRVFLLKV